MQPARWAGALAALAAFCLGAAAVDGDDEPNFIFAVEGSTKFWSVPSTVVYDQAPQKIVTSFADAAGCLASPDPGDCFEALAEDESAGGSAPPLAYLILNPNDWSRW